MSESTKTNDVLNASDIVPENWILRIAPPFARPYLTLARVDRPIGTWLLLLPCWWGMLLAGDHGLTQALWYAALFAVGAFVMRCAGCVWNDILDRDYDARVARTAERPIASGAISVTAAAIYMAVLSGTGLLVLLQFNTFTIALAISSLGLVALYPLMKRFTYWPQAWLGLTFNWGALVGWAAVAGSLNAPALYLYAAGFFWTLGYDTIYAHQDKEDDALIGVRSTALLFGARTKVWLSGFYAAAVALATFAGLTADIGTLYYMGLGLGALLLGWQVWCLDTEDPLDCLAKFKSNRWFGLILTVGIAAGHSW